MGNIFIVIIGIAAIVGLGLMLIDNGGAPAAVSAPSKVLAAIGLANYPDKLGWMDDEERLSASDIARLVKIRSMGSGGDGMHLLRGGLDRRDFELMRQDMRRARAAYPDIDGEKLTYGAWMPVALSAKVPDKWGGGNSHGTMGDDGKWYLDGGCYRSLVRPEYTERATGEATKKFYADLKERERKTKIERLRKDGPFAWWSGTGGSMTVGLDEKTGMVIVTRAKEWASKGTKWTLPFVVDEWADINAGDLDAIKKLPSFAQATEKQIDIQPSGVTITHSFPSR